MMKFDSIQTKLTGIAILFIIGTSVTMGGVGIRLTMGFLKQRFHENYVVLSEYLAKNAELGVLLEDTDMLGKLADNMIEQADVVKVSIKNRSGSELARAEKKYSQGSFVKIKTPIRQIQAEESEMFLYGADAQQEILGNVELFYSATGLRSLIKKLAVIFILISVVLSLFPVTWYWVMARSITAPLTDLLDVSKKVSRGDMDVRARGGELRETRTLANVFNEMLDSIKTQQQEMAKVHVEMAKQKSLAEIGQFSTMVAHELKNPIAIIKGSLDILKKPEIDEETRQTMVLYLDEEVQRLTRLVDEFLLFAKPKTLNYSRFSMNGFMTDLVKKQCFANSENDISLVLDPEDSEIQGDIYLLERAVTNILKNAQDNSDKDAGGIEVSGHNNSSHYTIRIKDRGKGIKAEILDDIFNPFFTTRAKGTGLGLAIVRDIIRSHGGDVHAWNRKSGGACFEIKIKQKKMMKDAKKMMNAEC